MDPSIKKMIPFSIGSYFFTILAVYYVAQFLLGIIWPISNSTVGSVGGGISSSISVPPGFAFPIIFIALILLVSLIIEKVIAKEKLSLHLASKMFLVLFVSLLFGGWVASLFVMFFSESLSIAIIISFVSALVIQLILLILAKYGLK